MESIEIKGFLTIDYAFFEIRKINILIGAQAQGKSVIAKLVYLFKKSLVDFSRPSIFNARNEQQIENLWLKKFEQIFPCYSWGNQEFSICYTNGNFNISITRVNVKGALVLKYSHCKEFSDSYKRAQKLFEEILGAHGNVPNEDDSCDSRRDDKNISSSNDTLYKSITLKNTLFIPASRSFFANLKNNIFTFLANDIDIDPLIKEFGLKYENTKRRTIHLNLTTHVKDASAYRKKINEIITDIVVGDHVYEEEQDWIINEGKKTNLAHASSGQQESLPMLLVLKDLCFSRYATIFIEEPEAHLFPVSQKQLISLLATMYNGFQHTFFITTHSPYILTAINNLVVGKDAYDKANADAEKLERLEKVLAFDELIRLEDVSAYTLNKGKLESIIDTENRLIGANLLDAVSDEFAAAFDVATEILYGVD